MSKLSDREYDDNHCIRCMTLNNGTPKKCEKCNGSMSFNRTKWCLQVFAYTKLGINLRHVMGH